MSTSREAVEKRSLADLREIVNRIGEWGARVAVIGGYAVRAYTTGYRYTKDIDIVIAKRYLGKLRGLLNNLGYETKETSFGIRGTKRVGGDDIKLHIGVGEVYDESTGHTIPVTDKTFEESRMRTVSGFYDKSAFKVPVIQLEDLLILKLMLRPRDKDVVDIIALLLDRRRDIDLNSMTSRCSDSGLSDHIRRQTLNLIAIFRKREAAKYWVELTGNRLEATVENSILQFLRKLEARLR